MKKCSLPIILSVAAAMVAPNLSFAESKTVVLSVPEMYSPACPVVARKALEKVPGVANVKASLERKEAVVTFDDAKTSVEKLVETTRNAGFPTARARP
jgi:mercuric ion binding protein